MTPFNLLESPGAPELERLFQPLRRGRSPSFGRRVDTGEGRQRHPVEAFSSRTTSRGTGLRRDCPRYYERKAQRRPSGLARR